MDRPHIQQQEVLSATARLKVVVKGRRWGGTTLAFHEAKRALREMRRVFYFVPNNGLFGHTVARFGDWIGLPPQAVRNIQFGVIDDHPPLLPDWADVAIFDEAAFMPGHAWLHVAQQLSKLQTTIVIGTPVPRHYSEPPDFLRLAYNFCLHDPKDRCRLFSYPTEGNPSVALDDILRAKGEVSEARWRTDFLAEFVFYEDEPPNPAFRTDLSDWLI